MKIALSRRGEETLRRLCLAEVCRPSEAIERAVVARWAALGGPEVTLPPLVNLAAIEPWPDGRLSGEDARRLTGLAGKALGDALRALGARRTTGRVGG